MEQISLIVDLEQQIKKYEVVVGPLTDKYPFNFAIIFDARREKMRNQRLILKCDGTFETNYLITGSCGDNYW